MNQEFLRSGVNGCGTGRNVAATEKGLIVHVIEQNHGLIRIFCILMPFSAFVSFARWSLFSASLSLVSLTSCQGKREAEPKGIADEIAPPVVEQRDVSLAVNGIARDESVTIAPGERLRLTIDSPKSGQTLVLADEASGVTWYEGPSEKLDLSFWALRTPEIRLLAKFSAASDSPPKDQKVVLRLNDATARLYPGLLYQVVRRDAASPLPGAAAFAPPKDLRFPYLNEVSAGYPPFRTAESIFTPPFQDVTQPWWKPLTYFHGIVPSFTITADPKKVADMGAIHQYPIGDVSGKFAVSARLSGELLIAKEGEYCFQPQANLPARLEVGGKALLLASGAEPLVVSLKRGAVPISLTVDHAAGAPSLESGLQWKKPGDAAFSPVPNALLVHRVEGIREKVLAAHLGGLGHRSLAVTYTQDDAGVAKILGMEASSAPMGTTAEFLKSVQPLVKAYTQGKQFGGDARVAQLAMKIICARLHFLRSHPEQLAVSGFGKTDGAQMRFHESLRPFLSQCEADPRLQELSLATRADLASYAVATCLSRSFFSESHHGTNDGYGDDNNLLVNFWRSASALDDPYAWDAAACLQDSHFHYAAGSGDGLSTDGIYLFHNANGRHIHMSGYGANWYDRVAHGGRLGTPWGYTPEQYRRLGEYVLAYEWLYYRGTTPFTANGRHNSHAGNATELYGRINRLVKLPEEALPVATRAALMDLKKRVDVSPDNTISGNRFFYRALYDVHRRKGYFIDVKMISPLVGGPETFAGAYPWNMAFGDGVTTLMRDGKEYANIHRNAPSGAYAAVRGWKNDVFEPKDVSLWRYRSLPGTTMLDDEMRAQDRYRSGSGATAGGVSDGMLGHCAFHYVNGQVGADVRKFYAFLEDGMVVLNSGVTMTLKQAPPEGVTMRSNLNQCDWRTDVKVIAQSGKENVVPVSGQGGMIRLPLTQRYWVEHDGIGYLILPTGTEGGANTPGTLCLDLTERTPLTPVPGSQIPEKTVEALKQNIPLSRRAKIFHLSIDHGPQVKDGKAAYIVCMSGVESKGREWLAKPPLTILSNENQLQAIVDERTGVAQAFFREAGVLTRDGTLLIAAPVPVSVMWNPETAKATVQDSIAACTTKVETMSDTMEVTLGKGLKGIAKEMRVAVPMPGTNDPDDRYRGAPVAIEGK